MAGSKSYKDMFMRKAEGSQGLFPASRFVGTAGWSVPSNVAADFPATGSQLERYAARLNAVEINSSYRPHRPTTYARWAATVPENFRFSVKLPKAMTHERRLEHCEDLLDRFVAEVTGLGPKLGVLLVQLPPSLRFEARIFDRFARALHSRIAVFVACEPRHATWFTPEADTCLAEAGIARVAADPPPAPGAARPGGWRGLAYLRLHGAPRVYYSDYDAAALAAVGEQLRTIQSTGVPAWCIFDNTAAFHALGNALSVVADLAEDQRNTGIR